MAGRTSIKLLVALTFSLLLCCAGQSHAQRITGTLIDAESGETIPFAHITNPERTRGTISDANGQFDFKLPDDPPIDTLLFTCLGYESRRIAVADLQRSDNELTLKPTSLNMGEVVVRADRKKKRDVLGNRFAPLVPGAFGASSSHENYSAKFAVPMQWDRDTPFKPVQARIRVTNKGKNEFLLFRSYLAERTEGQNEPGAAILRPGISERFTRNSGWVAIPFEDAPWLSEKKFYLVFEFIDDGQDNINYAPMMAARLIADGSFLLARHDKNRLEWEIRNSDLVVSLEVEYWNIGLQAR